MSEVYYLSNSKKYIGLNGNGNPYLTDKFSKAKLYEGYSLEYLQELVDGWSPLFPPIEKWQSLRLCNIRSMTTVVEYMAGDKQREAVS